MNVAEYWGCCCGTSLLDSGPAGQRLAAALAADWRQQQHCPHHKVASRSKATSFGSDPILDRVGAAGARLALAVVVAEERLQIFTCMGRWAPVLRLPNVLVGYSWSFAYASKGTGGPIGLHGEWRRLGEEGSRRPISGFWRRIAAPTGLFPCPWPPACTTASRARFTDPITTWLTKLLSMAAITAARSAQTVALGASRHASIVSKRGLRSGRPLGPLAGSLQFGGGSLGQAMFLRTEARRQARVAVVSTAGPWVYACGLGRPLGVAAAPAPLPPAMLLFHQIAATRAPVSAAH